MSVEIIPGPPIGSQDVDLLEEHLGALLPPEYRQFLVRSNGGDPAPHVIPAGPYPISIRYFYSIGGRGTRDIRWALRSSGPFPSGSVPIACDEGGNSFLLDVNGTDVGKVYFWDHERELEQEDPEHPDWTPATLIGASFAILLDSLTPD